jgi:hypothetical protein
MHHAGGNNLQTGFFEAAVDFANQVLLDTIRLNDGERLLNGHCDLPFALCDSKKAGHESAGITQTLDFTRLN